MPSWENFFSCLKKKFFLSFLQLCCSVKRRGNCYTQEFAVLHLVNFLTLYD